MERGIAVPGAVTIKVQKLNKNARLPCYATEGAAALDVSACLEESLILDPGGRAKVATGLAFEIPPGWEIQVRPRSGLALRDGITLVNSPGTIDSDYRGELCILLLNVGEEPFTVHDGDRIAQLVAAPVARAELVEVAALSESARGSGGFGSTGLTHRSTGGSA